MKRHAGGPARRHACRALSGAVYVCLCTPTVARTPGRSCGAAGGSSPCACITTCSAGPAQDKVSTTQYAEAAREGRQAAASTPGFTGDTRHPPPLQDDGGTCIR